jgi:hypothetical protein
VQAGHSDKCSFEFAIFDRILPSYYLTGEKTPMLYALILIVHTAATPQMMQVGMFTDVDSCRKAMSGVSEEEDSRDMHNNLQKELKWGFVCVPAGVGSGRN